jgi:hypothetical protein
MFDTLFFDWYEKEIVIHDDYKMKIRFLFGIQGKY